MAGMGCGGRSQSYKVGLLLQPLAWVLRNASLIVGEYYDGVDDEQLHLIVLAASMR